MAETPDKDQKTERATPRRLDEAREKGQVPYSAEAVAGIGLVATLIAILATGGSLSRTLGSIVERGVASVGELGPRVLSLEELASLVEATARRAAPAVLVLVAPVLAVVALAGYSQVGLHLATKAVTLDPNKVNPLAGIQRVLSMRGLVRTLTAAAKVAVAGAAMALVAAQDLPGLAAHASDDLGPTLLAFGRVLTRATVAGVLALLAISLVDLWYQRLQFERDMRMTKQEVKEEHKASEGDPLVRSRIRSIQREVAMRRMMADVPKATVVVTNPTHFAVALQYESEGTAAPRVVAKGVDQVALNIKRVAREAGVAIVEDAPLARALHRSCEIGDEIPDDLFGAVAGVLAYVYRVQGRPVGAAGGSE